MGINNKYFAGIGSRSCPPMLKEWYNLSKTLVDQNYILRSGGADGADTWWETLYDTHKGKKEIYLPWENFNNNKSQLFEITDDAINLAQKFHPNWHMLSVAGQHLMARNGFQVLGKDLATPVSMVICWTPEGRETGGTAQSIRIASHYNIPVFNLALEQDKNSLDSFLNLEELFGK